MQVQLGISELMQKELTQEPTNAKIVTWNQKDGNQR